MSGMSDDQSLAVGEESVEVLHPHWKTLVRPVVLAIVLVAAVLAGEVLIPAGKAATIERLALAVVAIAVLMLLLMYPLLVWRTTRYELTTKRLRLRTGVIARNGRDVPLSRITDVSFRKTLLDRFLGCGTLVVESAGEHGETTLTEIPHVEQVSATLFQLVEDERLRAAQNPAIDGQGDRPGAWLSPRLTCANGVVSVGAIRRWRAPPRAGRGRTRSSAASHRGRRKARRPSPRCCCRRRTRTCRAPRPGRARPAPWR
jgi:membrane protein YdbS with pleckstrin-like domain